MVSLCHRLDLQVDSLLFVASEFGGESLIRLCLEAEPDRAPQIAAQLDKIVDVLVVEIARGSPGRSEELPTD